MIKFTMKALLLVLIGVGSMQAKVAVVSGIEDRPTSDFLNWLRVKSDIQMLNDIDMNRGKLYYDKKSENDDLSGYSTVFFLGDAGTSTKDAFIDLIKNKSNANQTKIAVWITPKSHKFTCSPVEGFTKAQVDELKQNAENVTPGFTVEEIEAFKKNKGINILNQCVTVRRVPGEESLVMFEELKPATIARYVELLEKNEKITRRSTTPPPLPPRDRDDNQSAVSSSIEATRAAALKAEAQAKEAEQKARVAEQEARAAEARARTAEQAERAAVDQARLSTRLATVLTQEQINAMPTSTAAQRAKKATLQKAYNAAHK